MAESFPLERVLRDGLTYDAYRELLARAAETARPEGLQGQELERARYLPLNLRRSLRNEKTFAVSGELASAVAAIRAPQLWMVLTEPWCGDSAQNLPLIARVSQLSPQIDVRILLRDANLDLMDRYLTGGKQAIPKLVAFDTGGRELFVWGPRPRGAARLYDQEKQAGRTKEEIGEKLHLWYARDRGRDFTAEIRLLIAGVSG
jgi:hypothetical protein